MLCHDASPLQTAPGMSELDILEDNPLNLIILMLPVRTPHTRYASNYLQPYCRNPNQFPVTEERAKTWAAAAGAQKMNHTAMCNLGSSPQPPMGYFFYVVPPLMCISLFL
jgi:hypothetical protein